MQNSIGKNVWFANTAVTGTRQLFKPTRNDKRRRETRRVGIAQLVEKSNLLIINCAFRIKHCLKLALIQPPWLTGFVKKHFTYSHFSQQFVTTVAFHMCLVDLPSKLTMDEQSARSLNTRTECIHALCKILKDSA